VDTNLSKIREQGFRLLVEGLGAVGAVNFLRQFEDGSGDYTAERGEMHGETTIEEIAGRIQKRKEQQLDRV
jgi:hypothetical protein